MRKRMAKYTAVAFAAMCLLGVIGSMAEAQFTSQWIYMGGASWINVAPPVRPFGDPTISTFNAATGVVNQNFDYGLAQMGLPPVVTMNPTGGTTIYRSIHGKK